VNGLFLITCSQSIHSHRFLHRITVSDNTDNDQKQIPAIAPRLVFTVEQSRKEQLTVLAGDWLKAEVGLRAPCAVTVY
jgi:hypothetical protein